MIDALIFISQRPIVIALALLGAVMVTAGSLLAKPGVKSGLQKVQGRPPLARHLTSSGYAITAASILLFIIAGFVADLRP